MRTLEIAQQIFVGQGVFFRRHLIHHNRKEGRSPPLLIEPFLFSLFMSLMRFAVGAELIQFKTSFDRLLVLRGLVVDLLTVRTGQLDQIVLGHTFEMEGEYAENEFLASLSDKKEKNTKNWLKNKKQPSRAVLYMEPKTGLEPVTCGLQNRCSTN